MTARVLVFAIIVAAMAVVDGFVIAAHARKYLDAGSPQGIVTISLLAIAFMVFVVLEVLDPGTHSHITLWWVAWAMASANIALLIIALSPHARHIAIVVGPVVAVVVFAVGVTVLYPCGKGGSRDGA